MLTRLAIADFAVVRAAELEFGPGMTVISGETGAGKSLLVDALGFLCGQRADAGVVRHGAERAELTAEFALGDAPAARAWLPVVVTVMHMAWGAGFLVGLRGTRPIPPEPTP